MGNTTGRVCTAKNGTSRPPKRPSMRSTFCMAAVAAAERLAPRHTVHGVACRVHPPHRDAFGCIERVRTEALDAALRQEERRIARHSSRLAKDLHRQLVRRGRTVRKQIDAPASDRAREVGKAHRWKADNSACRVHTDCHARSPDGTFVPMHFRRRGNDRHGTARRRCRRAYRTRGYNSTN